MRPSFGWPSGHHVHRRRESLVALLMLTAALQVAGAIGIAYVAGWDATRAVLGRLDWPWLLAAAAVLPVAFTGYYYSYRGIFRADGGCDVSHRHLWPVVTAGFSGFLAYGGSALDDHALRAAGTGRREAKVRVSALAGLEQGVLGLGGCVASIAILAAGAARPTPGFTLPWAIVPVPGFLVAFWLAERFRDRLRGRSGWRGGAGIFLDAVHLIRELFRWPVDQEPAVLGMAVFWAGEAFAVWASMAAFGFRMGPAALVVGFATGLLFTRRTAPFGGAGVLMLILPVTIWYAGAPFAVAVVGVFAYRVLAIWLLLPVSLASLPRLRRLTVAAAYPEVLPTTDEVSARAGR